MLKLFFKKSLIFALGNHDDLSFGMCFHYGYYNFKKDFTLAKKYYLEAAKKGKEKEAYYHLGKLYKEEKSLVDAFYYWGINNECGERWKSALGFYEAIIEGNSWPIFIGLSPAMRQESIVKAMRSRRARDRRALTGEAGNASRRKVICGRHGHELRRSECVPDAGRIAA
ncbi:hypothetical protein [Rickettsiella endosymbiont of Dermanyssus gallinae]|uniref:hypothetical protein n=1 Tax=Rickettsiella endosymbiont of Dermanyssus gallinae TaxID=2856608 RepID=UPI001C52D274|nr:hypothetical protein [Rickettsiella endosymbiont of Dermanyssus gallinae]